MEYETKTYIVNFSLFALHVGLSICVAFVIPLMFAGQPEYLWMILCVALLSNQFWALIHEAIHAIFHPKRSVNNVAGRIMGICFGSAFGLLKPAHLVHHRLNRTEYEQPEISRSSSQRKDNVIYYYYLLIGLYINELVAPFMALLPRSTIDKALNTMFVKKSYNSEVAAQVINKGLSQVRMDTIIIVLVWGISFYLYGQYWYILALLFLVRGFLISFLDYVYHYRTPVDDVKHGYNLELPKLLEKYLLNFNLHGTHHLYPQESWEKLPELFRKNGGGYDKKYFSQAFNQLQGTVKL